MQAWILGILTALAVSGSSAASTWRLVSYDDTIAFALQTTDIATSGPVKTAWMAVVYPKQTHGLDVALFRHEWNCDARTSAVVVRVAYDEFGRVLDEVDTREPARAVVPDTAPYRVLRAVCDGEFEIPDPDGWSDVLSLMRDYRTGR